MIRNIKGEVSEPYYNRGGLYLKQYTVLPFKRNTSRVTYFSHSTNPILKRNYCSKCPPSKAHPTFPATTFFRSIWILVDSEKKSSCLTSHSMEPLRTVHCLGIRASRKLRTVHANKQALHPLEKKFVSWIFPSSSSAWVIDASIKYSTKCKNYHLSNCLKKSGFIMRAAQKALLMFSFWGALFNPLGMYDFVSL